MEVIELQNNDVLKTVLKGSNNLQIFYPALSETLFNVKVVLKKIDNYF